MTRFILCLAGLVDIAVGFAICCGDFSLLEDGAARIVLGALVAAAGIALACTGEWE